MYDVVAIGETLIDFTPNGTNEIGMQLFSCNPGGAPANVLTMCEKLGEDTAFIGKVGSDMFGDFLEETMRKAKIEVSGMVRSKDIPTSLAFVQLNRQGDRTFSFYRKPGADICLRPDEVKKELLRNCGVFHFGSVSLTDEPSRTATLESVREAKANGAIISFDPNYRPNLWDGEEHAVREIRQAAALADIIKASDEEMLLLTGERGLKEGTGVLTASGASLVVVTLGPRGAYFRSGCAGGFVPTFDVPTVDTTGAGDAFWGAFLHCVIGKSTRQLREMTGRELNRAVVFANAAGSLATTKKGAIPAMPTLGEIQECVRNGRRFDNTEESVCC